MDNKFITCPVCKKFYSNPKILPCLDTICSSCLTQNGNSIRCPICSSTSLVPAGGCEKLPDNMLIRKMLEIVRPVPAPSLDKFCDVCSDEQGGSSDHGSHRCVDTNNTAETFCVECEQNLCSSCGNMHRKVKATRSHTLVGICDQGGSKSTSKSRVSRCEHHPSECVTLYCWNCSKLLCTVCYVSNHKQHECSDVRNAAGKFVELVNRNLPLLTAKLESNRQTEKQVEEMKLRFAQQVSGVEAEVDRKAEEMHALIVRHKRDLLEKMEKINQQVSGEFQQVEQKLKNEIDAASGFIPVLHELLGSGSDIDHASLIKDVDIQIQRILSSRPQVIPSTDVTFVGSGGRKPQEPMLQKKYQGCRLGNIVDPRKGQPEATNLIGEINFSTTTGKLLLY